MSNSGRSKTVVRMIPIEAKAMTNLTIHPKTGRWIKRWTNEDFNALWRTIYGEAAKQSYMTKIAIGFVVCNVTLSNIVVKQDERVTNSINAACYLSGIFPCWASQNEQLHKRLTNIDASSPEAMLSIRAAIDVLLRVASDPTGGADRYHPEGEIPGWATSLALTAKIGKRWFYRTL